MSMVEGGGGSSESTAVRNRCFVAMAVHTEPRIVHVTSTIRWAARGRSTEVTI